MAVCMMCMPSRNLLQRPADSTASMAQQAASLCTAYGTLAEMLRASLLRSCLAGCVSCGQHGGEHWQRQQLPWQEQ
jgi:hypothetical protein